MFPAHSPEQAAIASQLADELDRYSADLRTLLERRWDPELYRRLSDQFDRMQMFSQALPRIASTWTELLISRVELTHALWGLRAPSRIGGRVVAAHARHEELLRELRGKCRRYLHDEDDAAHA
jgi:hypothetical protein